MAQDVIVHQGHEVVTTDWREKIEVIRQTVAKDATPAQLEMFLHLANRYQLDPFVKEIYFAPQIGIITSRDGYLKVAQRDPDYDGIVSCAVHENDRFSMRPSVPDIDHEFAAVDRGAVIGAYAMCFHKQRRPAVAYATLSEYKKNTSVWTTYTSAMICKVAEVFALKRQFAISGLVTEEEVGRQAVAPTTPPVIKTGVAEINSVGDARTRIAELDEAFSAIGATDRFAEISTKAGVPANLGQAKKLISVLESSLAQIVASADIQMPLPVEAA